MERIGIAASKIAKEGLLLYNFYVLLISMAVSLLLFLLSGTVIFAGLWMIRLFLGPLLPTMSQHYWNLIFCWALIALTFLVTLVNLIAVSKNIKLRK